jgi:endoglucanase
LSGVAPAPGAEAPRRALIAAARCILGLRALLTAMLFAATAHAAPAQATTTTQATATAHATTTAHAGMNVCVWPAWQRFKALYVSDDGRVVDASTPQHITVSEGQAYALTFALIGNDPAAFAKILAWTQNNLAHGNLAGALPAWKWGRAADGKWTVLDVNSASDADLWLAYALSEAGRLWKLPAYTALARTVSDRILKDEVAFIPGLGPTVLPGPQGFVADQVWRLNASYLPIQVLRVVGNQGGNALWDGVLQSSLRVIVASAPRGFAADWIAYRQSEGFITDTVTSGVGSYDAIRVYLWAGMLAATDPLAKPLISQLRPMQSFALQHALPPESFDTSTLASRGEGLPGFSAALLPLIGQAAPRSYRERAESRSLENDQHYYSDALTLFGLGFSDGRFRFDRNGHLEPRWNASCHAS